MIIANRQGHTKASPGASDILNEIVENEPLLKEVNRLLIEKGHKIVSCYPGDGVGGKEWNIGVAKANESEAYLFFSIHFNSTKGAYGSEILTSSMDKTILPYANRILNNLESLGFTNRGIKIRDDLAETVGVDLPAMIVEVCFIHEKDAAIYRRVGMNKVARAIANGIDPSILLDIPKAKVDVKYQGHIQEIGWQEPKFNDEICGTTGQSLRLEALMITYPGILFRAHIENLGWTNYRASGEIIGTIGSGLRIESIEILSDKLEFSVHIEGIGWTPYKKNAVHGTVGQARRIEAIRIREV